MLVLLPNGPTAALADLGGGYRPRISVSCTLSPCGSLVIELGLVRLGSCGAYSDALPRKEVIQPQLPLRLPCYDFVPVTTPTLGRYLPCGLAHGLQVLAAPMT